MRQHSIQDGEHLITCWCQYQGEWNGMDAEGAQAMSDCTTNHAHLIKLEGELHPSGKDYYCTDCGDVFEVEVKPATIGVGYGQPQGETKR